MITNKDEILSFMESLSAEEMDAFVKWTDHFRNRVEVQRNRLSHEEAFKEIERIRKKIKPKYYTEFDYKKELAEYREERYGNLDTNSNV